MCYILKKSLVLPFIMLFCTTVNASLIENGSFEWLLFENNSNSKGLVHQISLNTFHQNNGWDIYEKLPGWFTSYGHGVELQRNIVTDSAHGNHHIELDSHPNGASNSVITQTINFLDINAEYLLEFSYKPRTNINNDNGINVFWSDLTQDFDINSDAIFSIDNTRNEQKKWQVQSVILTAEENTMNLSFGAFGIENTLGGLIDYISLVKISDARTTSVPEPSILLIILLPLFFLLRRKHNLLNSRKNTTM
jgi:hypothetical protein